MKHIFLNHMQYDRKCSGTSYLNISLYSLYDQAVNVTLLYTILYTKNKLFILMKEVEEVNTDHAKDMS